MHQTRLHDLVLLGASLLAVVAALLWSWNTLAPLFALPEAETRHVLASIVMAAALRALLSARGKRHNRREYRK